MRVAVLVSASRHPVSALPRACRNDALALQIARSLHPEELLVLHAGDAADPSLPEYLALGAPEVHVAPISPGDDVVHALATHLRDKPLILAGSRSESGHGSGMLPYLLAAKLERPVVGDIVSLERTGAELTMLQYMTRGRRRRLEVPPAAIVAVHPHAAAECRYAFGRIRAGRISLLQSEPVADTDALAWQLESSNRIPQPLRAAERRSAHTRLIAAIAAPTRGGQVVKEGSDVEKAQLLASYLQQHGYYKSNAEKPS